MHRDHLNWENYLCDIYKVCVAQICSLGVGKFECLCNPVVRQQLGLSGLQGVRGHPIPCKGRECLSITKCKHEARHMINFKLFDIVAAFRGMHVSPAKQSYMWLPRKCDYRTDAQTDRQKPDKVFPMCSYASQATQKVAPFIDFTISL